MIGKNKKIIKKGIFSHFHRYRENSMKINDKYSLILTQIFGIFLYISFRFRLLISPRHSNRQSHFYFCFHLVKLYIFSLSSCFAPFAPLLMLNCCELWRCKIFKLSDRIPFYLPHLPFINIIIRPSSAPHSASLFSLIFTFQRAFVQ